MRAPNRKMQIIDVAGISLLVAISMRMIRQVNGCLHRAVLRPMPSISWAPSSGDREPARLSATARRWHNRWLGSDRDSRRRRCYCCHLYLWWRPRQSAGLQLGRGMSSDPLRPRCTAARLLSTPVSRATTVLSFHHPTRQMSTHNRYLLRHYRPHSIFGSRMMHLAAVCYRKPVGDFVVFALRLVPAEAYVTMRE